jgi:hypothetical protein
LITEKTQLLTLARDGLIWHSIDMTTEQKDGFLDFGDFSTEGFDIPLESPEAKREREEKYRKTTRGGDLISQMMERLGTDDLSRISKQRIQSTLHSIAGDLGYTVSHGENQFSTHHEAKMIGIKMPELQSSIEKAASTTLFFHEVSEAMEYEKRIAAGELPEMAFSRTRTSSHMSPDILKQEVRAAGIFGELEAMTRFRAKEFSQLKKEDQKHVLAAYTSLSSNGAINSVSTTPQPVQNSGFNKPVTSISGNKPFSRVDTTPHRWQSSGLSRSVSKIEQASLPRPLHRREKKKKK